VVSSFISFRLLIAEAMLRGKIGSNLKRCRKKIGWDLGNRNVNDGRLKIYTENAPITKIKMSKILQAAFLGFVVPRL